MTMFHSYVKKYQMVSEELTDTVGFLTLLNYFS